MKRVCVFGAGAIGGHLAGRLPRLDPRDVIWDTVGPARAIGCTIRSGAEVV